MLAPLSIKLQLHLGCSSIICKKIIRVDGFLRLVWVLVRNLDAAEASIIIILTRRLLLAILSSS